MKEKTIKIQNLSIGYFSKKQSYTVAKSINADIRSGELTCLLGANGIGKSTLLKTLSAFLPPLSGNISILNKDIKEYNDKDFAKKVSVVLTEKIEIKNITARELIGLGRSPYTGFWGNLNKDDQSIVDKAIALVKIEDLANRVVQTLSDGERQKILIAKALVQETPIILLDEPTAFLDFPSKVEIMQLLHNLSRATNKTIFLSTHDLELALQIADKIWLMDKQNGIEIGTPEDLSINGSLNHFFARKGIIFDQKTGLFRIENQMNRHIRIKGHGFLYIMVQKALSRNGIMASHDNESDSFIEIVDNNIRLYLSKQSNYISVKTIEELLNLML